METIQKQKQPSNKNHPETEMSTCFGFSCFAMANEGFPRCCHPQSPLLQGPPMPKSHPQLNQSCHPTDPLQVSGVTSTHRSCSRETPNVRAWWWNAINQRIMDRKVGGC